MSFIYWYSYCPITNTVIQILSLFMDIVRSKQKKTLNSKVLGIVGVVSCGVLLLAYTYSDTGGSYRIDKNALLIDQVQRGELNVSVRGIGVLVPKDIRWIATEVQGRVERILIKPGAQVKAGDLLLELRNSQLVQQLEETKWELEALEAETLAQQVSLESDLLDQQAAVINAKLSHQRTMLTLNAQKTLLEQGTGVISQIAHEEVKIEVALNKERWQLEIKRLAKRKENLAAQAVAYQARLNRMRRILQRVESQVDGLHVKATMDSIVQEMPVELGQQVNSGTNLARLARKGQFIAELRIPEKLIQNVAIDQLVSIDTRTSKIKGRVSRIDPAVINGSVQIDVELIGPIPSEARPDLTVEGVIEIARLADTLYVKRPMFAKSFTQGTVYLLDADGQSASKQVVAFGQVSSKYIQINGGLNSGETIIVSDTSGWEEHQQISLN
jgi:multidrug efflux pump subunit AcrA (membrane-fusion protein)